MDEVFGEIMACGFGFDSIMLRLLRAAMDKAHEKVQPTNGSIELLNARSKFYEMAMILVEGCSNLIEEKTEIPECNREKMLSDLMESRDMVRRRLKELKLGIIEKDRELMERMENEWKLRQTLEMKEREIVSLRGKLELERRKSEALLSDQANGYEGKEGDICELKNSVDQQVWSIKQKLEDERMSLTSGNEHYGTDDSEMMNQFSRPEQTTGTQKSASESVTWCEQHSGGGTTPFDHLLPEFCDPRFNVIEQMSSDIDSLKGTLDLAFGRMQHAEMRPLEKQWRWNVEKDTMLIMIQGFMSSLQQDFDQELGERAKQFPFGFLNGHWSELFHEVTVLHQELEALCSSDEVQVRRAEKVDRSDSSTNICRTSSEPLPEIDYVQESREEEQDADGSHYVAKMIKNHESIIRIKREELNWLKREILREKECLSIKILKDPNNLGRRIHEVIVRLENIIKWDAKIGGVRVSHENEKLGEEDKMNADTLTDFEETELDDEVGRLRQEIDDLNLLAMIMEENYVVLYKGLMTDFSFELENHETEIAMTEDIFTYVLGEMVNEWNLSFETKSFEIQVKEEVYYTVCRNVAEDFFCDHGLRLTEYHTANWLNCLKSNTNRSLCQDEEVEVPENQCDKSHTIDKLTETIESTMKEDVCMVFLRETIMECKIEMDAYKFENLIREEIYHLVIVKAVQDACVLRECETPKSIEVFGEENFIKKLDCLLKCCEVEEDLMIRASFEIREHSANNGIVASECEEVDERDAIEWLLTEEESTFNSVRSKLENALQQLFTSKALLRELQDSLGVVTIGDHMNPVLGVLRDGEHSFFIPKDNQVLQLNPSDSVFSPLRGFLQMLMDFQCIAHQKLDINLTRLEELGHQTHQLVQLVASLKKRELLYRSAFLRRCHNLRLAEAEVDMLGDQVDALLGLLEKIYLTLDQYSPVLSRYFEVTDILNLMKKELKVV